MILSLKLGLRTVARNFWLTAINLLGLAIAMAAAFVIGLFVLNETSYDRWIPHADELYLATTTWHLAGRDPVLLGPGPNPLKSLVEKNYPEVRAVTRLFSRNLLLRVDGDVTPRGARIAFVDTNFFDLFDLPVRSGSPGAALADLRALVLTEEAAQRLLGTKDALGRTIRMTIAGREYVYRVRAVLADLPSNTHLSSQIFARLEESDFHEPNTFASWGNVGPLIYLRLAPDTDIADLEARINEEVARRVRAQIGAEYGFSAEISLLPLPQIHFAAKERRGISATPPGDPMLLLALSLIALLVLVMAVVNYVNLATAIAMRRTREVALRRVFGASRSELARGYFAESILTVALAGVLAVAIVQMVLPRVGDVIGMDFATASVWSTRGLLLVAGLTLLTGLAAGTYPALLMARFRPSRLFADAGAAGWGGNHWLRTGFVLLQFAVSTGLIVSTTIILEQARHLRRANLGYDPKGLIVVGSLGNDRVRAVRQTLLERIAALPGVTSAAMSWNAPGATSGVKSETLRHPGEGQTFKVTVEQVEVDFGFFETLGVRPLAGRLLTRKIAADDTSMGAGSGRPVNILLNAAAVRALGFQSPQAAIDKEVRFPRGNAPARIVGVVPNMRFGPILGEPPRPTYYLYAPEGFHLATIRYRGLAPAQAMAAIGDVWRELLPEVPFHAFHVDERLATLTASEQAQGRILAVFAALAVALAAVGIYGIAAFSAQRRAREMALRRVFGASTPQLLNRILGHHLALVAAGGLIGATTASLVSARWLAQYPERIAHTATPYLMALVLAALVALGVVATEAVRVARIAPAQALREE